MESLYFLTQGLQTKFTDKVYEYVEKSRNLFIENSKIGALPEPLRSIHRTCNYISQIHCIRGFTPQPRTKREEEANQTLKERIFRQRDLDQVLKEGYYPTCSDIGLLFRGLMAAQGYPTAHIEAFHEDYLFNRSFHGHVFCRVFDEDKSMIVNPTQTPKIVYREIEIFPYVIFREGLDSWDVGIKGYDDMHRLKEENIESLLRRYENSSKSLINVKTS